MLEVGTTPPPDNSWIGRYEIRRERGRGAMGVVYEAHDSALDRTVALKTIRLPFASTPAELEEFEKRFFAEARVAACLSHPGIVTVHDVARDPETGTLYIALEYLEGRTLAEVIRGGVAMSSLEALRITASIATALHHAHLKGGRSPGHQAVQHHDPGQRRAEDHGLRHRQGGGCPGQAHGRRPGARNTSLHVSRAGSRAQGGRPERPLLPGSHRLRAPYGPSRLRGRQHREDRRPSDRG